MTMTAAEQYELELINRARLDPQAEAARYGISLNDGLAAGTINGEAKQVLAPNADLEAAAQGHSEWMLASDVFSHTGAGSSSAGTRIGAEGYAFTGSWGWAENLSAVLTTGAIDLEAAIEQHHSTLFLSAGHRSNTMNGQMREIGIAQVQGQFVQGGVTYNTAMLTENFAYSGTKVFVTGVVYDDTDADAFYGIGEGMSGIRITAAGVGDTSEAAGGYSVGVAPSGSVSVSVAQGSATLATLTMDMSTGNGKLDLVMGSNNLWRLELSTSATLVSGVADATLLGVADLNLTGHSAANQLIGNGGNNTLSGAGGSDALGGGGGTDMLLGGQQGDWLDGGAQTDFLLGATGRDTIAGGEGRDWMSGGGGADVFLFGSTGESSVGWTARDMIFGFERGQDKIDLSFIDANILTGGNQGFAYIGASGFSGGGAASAGQMRSYQSTAGNFVLLEMDTNGDGYADMQLVVRGVTTLTAGDFIL